MNSLILRTAVKLLLPLLLVFSIILLLRGHNVPGGGFVGGLLAASGFALHAMAFGSDATRQLLRVNLHLITAVGLLCGFASACVALLVGAFSPAVVGAGDAQMMAGQWIAFPMQPVGVDDELKLGTPVMFDIGVYLTVVGVVLTMIFSLSEAEEV